MSPLVYHVWGRGLTYLHGTRGKYQAYHALLKCVTHFTCTKSVHQTLANLQHAWHVKEPSPGRPLGCQHNALKMSCCVMSEYNHYRTLEHTKIHLDMPKNDWGLLTTDKHTNCFYSWLYTFIIHCRYILFVIKIHSLVQFPFAYFDLSLQ